MPSTRRHACRPRVIPNQTHGPTRSTAAFLILFAGAVFGELTALLVLFALWRRGDGIREPGIRHETRCLFLDLDCGRAVTSCKG
jgi:hypothetical protein